MRLVSQMHRSVDRCQQRHALTGFLFAVRQKYDEDQGRYLAATVTYYAFFSIFPLLLVLVTLLGYALEGNTDLQHRVLDSALADFPVIGDQLQTNVHSLQGSWPALVIGHRGGDLGGHGRVPRNRERDGSHLGRAVQAARESGALARARAAVDRAARRRDHRRHVPRRPEHVGALVRPRPAAARTRGSRSLINFAVFVTVFRVLTSASPSLREVVPGAIVAALAWAILQAVGAYIVRSLAAQRVGTYGIFALVLGLLSWL